MVISFMTLGRFLFLQFSPQLVVGFQSMTGWWQLLQKDVPQMMKKSNHPLSHQPVLEIIQVEQKILGILVPLVS